MNNNIIPAMVPAVGPQYTVFPPEILIKIFKYAVMRTDEDKEGRVVNSENFFLINNLGPFQYLRRVSKMFSVLSTIAFYEVNEFRFRIPGPRDTKNRDRPYLARLPPLRVRNSLRCISIEIQLYDYYTTEPLSLEINRIIDLTDFFKYCHGARQLRDLTTFGIGFGALEVLNITIVTDFQYEGALALVKSAGFSVKAGKVKVVAVGVGGRKQDWHYELQKAVAF